MKHLSNIFFFVAISFFSIASLHAQEWEQVGWQGGIISIEAQLGHTLYGASGNAFYKSTNWGQTWSMFRTGLPQSSIIFRHVLATDGRFIFVNANKYSLRPSLF